MSEVWKIDPRNDRFDPQSNKQVMKAVVTMGNGGYEKLSCRIVVQPEAKPHEYLIKVLAAGVNNTEINTRIGWYSSSVTDSTEKALQGEDGNITEKSDGGWNAATPFPFIQGTDCCGRVVGAGPGADSSLIGSRVLVRACMRTQGFESMENYWMGSDFDGAFAEYVTVPAGEVFPVASHWSDAELGTIPCAYGTAENMVHRAGVKAGDHVLVTGASGGVGSAVVQLVKRRGASVTAVVGREKQAALLELGADSVFDRDEDLTAALGESSVDVAIDNVAGPAFPSMLKVLKRGGRYASSGAIGGPIVTLDMRSMYLKDITLIGCTAWDEPVFPNLISYIERDEIKPLVAKSFPLERIVEAQKEFLLKKHVGNFVLIP